MFNTPLPTAQPRKDSVPGFIYVTAIFGNDDSDSDDHDPWVELSQDSWNKGRLSTSPAGLFEGDFRALLNAAKGQLYQEHSAGKPKCRNPSRA